MSSRIVCFMLRRFVGLYLKRELDISQVQSSLTSGRYVLQGPLEFNVDQLNANILDNSPFEMLLGSIDSIEVNAPWSVIMGQNVNISVTIKGVHARFVLKDAMRVTRNETFQDSITNAMTRSVLGNIRDNDGDVQDLLSGKDVSSEVGAGGTLGSLVNHYIQSMKVTIVDADVQVCVKTSDGGADVLHLRIPHLELTKTTPVPGGVVKEVFFDGMHAKMYGVPVWHDFPLHWNPDVKDYVLCCLASESRRNTVNFEISDVNGLMNIQFLIQSLHGILSPEAITRLHRIISRTTMALPPGNELDDASEAIKKPVMSLKVRLENVSLACTYPEEYDPADIEREWIRYLDKTTANPTTDLSVPHSLVVVQGVDVRSGGPKGKDNPTTTFDKIYKIFGGKVSQLKIAHIGFWDVFQGNKQSLLEIVQRPGDPHALGFEIRSTAPVPTHYAEKKGIVCPMEHTPRYFALQEISTMIFSVNIDLEVAAVDRLSTYVQLLKKFTRDGSVNRAGSALDLDGYYDALDTCSQDAPPTSYASEEFLDLMGGGGGGGGGNSGNISPSRQMVHVRCRQLYTVANISCSVRFPSATTVPPHVWGPLTSKSVQINTNPRCPHLVKALHGELSGVQIEIQTDTTRDPSAPKVTNFTFDTVMVGFRDLMKRSIEPIITTYREPVQLKFISSNRNPATRASGTSAKKFTVDQSIEDVHRLQEEITRVADVNIVVNVPRLTLQLYQDQYALFIFLISKLSENISMTLSKVLARATTASFAEDDPTERMTQHRDDCIHIDSATNVTTMAFACDQAEIHILTPRLDARGRPLSNQWFHADFTTTTDAQPPIGLLHKFIAVLRRSDIFVAAMLKENTNRLGLCCNVLAEDVQVEELLPVVPPLSTAPPSPDYFSLPWGSPLPIIQSLHPNHYPVEQGRRPPALRILFGQVATKNRIDNTVLIRASHLCYLHWPFYPGDDVFSCINFFITDTPRPLTDSSDALENLEFIAVTSRVVVESQQLFIDYSPIDRPGRIVGHIASAKMSGQFTTNSESMRIHVSLLGSSIFLHPKTTEAFHTMYKDVAYRSTDGISSDLAVIGFQRVLILSEFEPLTLKIERNCVKNKPLVVTITGAKFRTSFAGDSLVLFSELVREITDGKHMHSTYPPVYFVLQSGKQYLNVLCFDLPPRPEETRPTHVDPFSNAINVAAIQAALRTPLVSAPTVAVERRFDSLLSSIPEDITFQHGYQPRILHAVLKRIENDADVMNPNRKVDLVSLMETRSQAVFQNTDDDEDEEEAENLGSGGSVRRGPSEPHIDPLHPRGRWFAETHNITDYVKEPFLGVSNAALVGCPFDTSFPDDHPNPEIDIQLIDCSLRCTFAGGKDFAVIYGTQYLRNRLNRSTSGDTHPSASPVGSEWELDFAEVGTTDRVGGEILEVYFGGGFAHFASFKRTAETQSVQRIQHCKLYIREVEINDRIQKSSVNRILTSLRHHEDRYVEDNAIKLTWDIMSPRATATPEHRVLLDFSPFRVVIDQEAIAFLSNFLANATGAVEQRNEEMLQQQPQQTINISSYLAEAQRLGSKRRAEVEEDRDDMMHTVIISPAEPPTATATQTPTPPLFFQLIKISPLKIVANYHPNSVNSLQLLTGDFIQLANLTTIEDLVVDLRPVIIRGLNVDGATRHLLKVYEEDVTGYHFGLRAVCTIGPMRSIANVGRGMADIVLLPIEHYETNQGVYKGFAKGVYRFSRTVLSEMCNVGAEVGRLASGGVGIVANAFGFNPQEDPTQFGRGNEPGSVSDGMQRAKDVLSMGMQQAQDTIARVKTEGRISEVPLVVLLPIRAAFGSATQSILALRNAIQPNYKRENDRLFKK